MLPGLSIPELMGTIEQERATILMGVPFIYVLAINMAEEQGVKYDLSSLRLCGSAGAPLSIDIIQRFRKGYGKELIDLWGLTEAAAHVTLQPIDGSGKLGSVGKVLPGWELKVVDDGSRELPPDQQGEVIVRGPIMNEYYNNPEATAEVIKDGWLYTGDMGRVDGDGNLFITGRKKKMLIAKGQNIFPGDIEGVLSAHPKVAAVMVVGIPDELRGEVVKAIISLKEGEVATEEELRRFCREHMADYKLPKQIIFVDSLPKTDV
jgi:long-chain acyl-CoA synthetase